LTVYLGHKADSFRRSFLDLAAIGTITDCVPCSARTGLLSSTDWKRLQETKKPGLRALIAEAGFADRILKVGDVSHQMGPRLNSASRMDETQDALDLLLTKDETEAYRLARRLHELNLQRREDTKLFIEEAMAQVAQQDIAEARCLVVSSSGWPAGMVGFGGRQDCGAHPSPLYRHFPR